MTKDQVLRQLQASPGSYLSGQALSQSLGVSRTAVWKAISSLRDQGYHIESTPNKGYALMASPSILDRVAILSLLPAPPAEGQPACQLHCLDTVDSTNTYLKQLALQGASAGTVVTAEEQSAGRGRRGRSFHSPKGSGLYLSLLLRPQVSTQEVTNLTAWVAVALCRGIQACCGLQPQIKWTNDIVLNQKKVCGILTELSLEPDSDLVDYVVIGCGLNVNQRAQDFPQELASIATSLALALGAPVDRQHLCASLLSSLGTMAQDFPLKKTDYLKEYRRLCLTPGKKVQVLQGTQSYPATALEIDQDFRLVVEDTQGQIHTLSTGEVSVRGMFGYI